PKSGASEEALALLKDGRIARAELVEIQAALDLARRGSASLAPLVLDRVKRELDNPRAAALLSWVCLSSTDAPAEPPPAFAEAPEPILSRFANSPDVLHFCEALSLSRAPGAGKYEQPLRTLWEKNPNRKVRYRALFGLASIARQGGASRQDEAVKL